MTWFSPVLVVCCLLAAAQGLTVQVPGLGSVQGTSSLTTWTGRTVYEFRGLRYAQSPSGERRFKESVKETAWTGVRDATEYGQACPQPGAQSSLRSVLAWLQPDPEVASMQRRAALRANDPEDCLTLDVYTLNATWQLPVLVFFHGGGFLYGSSAAHRASYLLEGGVVLVAPQYRLGVLGFFHLNTVDAPGNAGLADQLMALQWVRDNIAAFGGDPQKVTIAGSSAGAASVSLHMLSPRATGLFHGVIAQSGSALTAWALDETQGEHHSRRVANLAGCDPEVTSADLTTCMRNASVTNIVRASIQYSLSERRAGRLGMGGYTPTLQRAVPGVVPVVGAAPRTTLERGDYHYVPLLMGVNRHEGIFFLDLSYQFFLVPNDLVHRETYLRSDFVTTLLNLYGVDDSSHVMLNAVLKQYFNKEDLGNFTRMTPGLVDLTGTLYLKGPTLRQVRMHAPRAPTFLFSFDYQGSQTLLSPANTTVPVPGGVTHADDTLYLFPRSRHPLNERDTGIAKRMVELYTNFVIHGNPTPPTTFTSGVPPWPSYSRDQEAFMSLGEEAILLTDFEATYTVARDEKMTPPQTTTTSPATTVVPTTMVPTTTVATTTVATTTTAIPTTTEPKSLMQLIYEALLRPRVANI